MALHVPGYRIIRKINQGGMSTVYLAIQISVGRVVAIKVMNPALSADPAFNERFQREATIVGQLSHPNIVAIYDIGQKDNLSYIAMDYLPGGSVHDKMIKGLTAEEALRVTREIANALDHAHEKGYIHRDIKPENILFRADNSAVLSDFGVAKVMIGVSRMTHVGTVVGTPQYMSPEQTRGQAVDARSDLYSLGVVFYEMLTGSLPYQAQDAVTIALKHISAPIPRLPLQYQAYQKILDKFLAKEPDQRFQTGREVSAAIEQLEANTNKVYVTNTVTEDLSVLALFKALMAATFYALSWRWRRIKNLRWSRSEGFYHKQSEEDAALDRVQAQTLFITRVEVETNINRLLHSQKFRTIKWVGAASLAIILWCAFSVFMQTALRSHIKSLPHFLQTATSATASMFITQPVPPKASTTKVRAASSTAVASSSLVASSVTSSLIASSAPLSSSSVASSTPLSSTPASEKVQSSVANASSSISADPTFALNVKVIPEKARVRLLNSFEKYKEGIQLPAGRYRVEISLPGYQTKTDTIEIKNKPVTMVYQLEEIPTEKIDAPKYGAPIPVAGGKNAPEMIKIPAGVFMMGDADITHATPVHKVVIAKAFAISKYEITFNDYDLFAKATDRALPGDNSWGRENHPIINVSWNDAQAYVAWLSKTTGKKYRLPTEAEWEYVARAGSQTHYWWSDSDQDAKGKANCRRGCYSNYSGLFGSKTAPVGSYPPNNLGAYDTAGNVAEWVQDCYADNYNNANANGLAYETKSCATRVARGGSTKDNVQNLTSAGRENHVADFVGDTLGFRVVMELN